MRLDWVELGWLALAVVAVTLLAARAFYLWFVRFRGGARRRKGLDAERGASAILTRAGYTIIAHGLAGQAHVLIDGRRCPVTVHADFLVQRHGRRFVVEVKSGRARLATIDTTRRQLLEYTQVFGVSEVLLVDTVDAAIHTISFDY